MLPWVLGFAGVIYGAAASICGAVFIVLAWQLRRSGEGDRLAAHRLFAFSIVYLFVLFAALLAGNVDGRSLLYAPIAPAAVGLVSTASLG
jgi:protoheme IX farnesyltransferase